MKPDWPEITGAAIFAVFCAVLFFASEARAAPNLHNLEGRVVDLEVGMGRLIDLQEAHMCALYRSGGLSGRGKRYIKAAVDCDALMQRLGAAR